MNLKKLAEENGVELDDLKKGFEAEKKEHRDKFNDEQVAQIALAHLEENEDYYDYLEEMEEEMDEGEEVEAPEMEPTIHISAEQFPELKTAKLGQVFNLSVKAKVKNLGEEYSCLDILQINDKAFADKDYKDLMEEEGDE